MNHEISKLKIKNFEEKPNKSYGIKPGDIEASQLNDKQEKTIDKDFINPKNLNKEDLINKKGNDNEDVKTLTSKEKNTITIDLTNDEKIVFSQLGINPLIKLGKEYLTSNNFVRIKENNKEKENTLDNKKGNTEKIRKILKSKEDIEIKNESSEDTKYKSTKKINENNEVLFSDNNDEIDLTDVINNARKKRRRSSASIE